MALSAILLYPQILVSPSLSISGSFVVNAETTIFGEVIQVYTGGSDRVIVGNNVFFNFSKADQIQSDLLVVGDNETGVGFLVDEFDIKLVEVAS